MLCDAARRTILFNLMLKANSESAVRYLEDKQDGCRE